MTSRLLILILITIPISASAQTDANDRLKLLQTANVASARQSIARPYHFGSQGAPGPFSNHATHTNRLIPFYTFGKKLDPSIVTGANSVYRNPEKLKALYGFLPDNTLNPAAEYADQSDLALVLSRAADAGAKHIFIVWFDGMDWPTTQAAAIARTGKVYTEGKGTGLIFQDDTAAGTSKFGYYVTAPTYDRNLPNTDAQTVTIPAGGHRGGYDADLAGPNPWTQGPLAPKAPGYLRGQSATALEKAAVAALGRVIHPYTDSAPSAAEFVSGKKSYNNSINVKDDGAFIPTLFHSLQNQGWKVGTVTSVPFPHASPAAMYAHNVHRDDYQDLARDMLGLPSIAQQTGKDVAHPGLDVVIGAGFGQTASAKGLPIQGKNAVPGNLYLTAADQQSIDARNGGKYVVVQTTPGVNGASSLSQAADSAAASAKRLFGFFGNKGPLGHLPYRTADGRFDPAPDLNGNAEQYSASDLIEQPTLADMTRASLTVLAAKPDQRFLLFIEAGDVDFALHANNLDNAVGAVYSGEAAVKAVIDWVEQNSNWTESALVVAADHGHYLVLDDLQAIAGDK